MHTPVWRSQYVLIALCVYPESLALVCILEASTCVIRTGITFDCVGTVGGFLQCVNVNLQCVASEQNIQGLIKSHMWRGFEKDNEDAYIGTHLPLNIMAAI